MMLGIRAFANLFETQEGRALAEARFDEVRAAVRRSPAHRLTRV